jgi:proteic killer suppression protein
MDIPGFRLHPLKGRMREHHAVSVSGNWRVMFRFEDGNAVDVDYLDYH